MTYHSVREPEPEVAPVFRAHPFVGGFLTCTVVAAITAVLAVAAGVPAVLYGSVGSTGVFLALAGLYRWLSSRSVDVRGQVSGVSGQAPDTQRRSPLRALTRVRGVLRRGLTPDLTPDT